MGREAGNGGLTFCRSRWIPIRSLLKEMHRDAQKCEQ